MSATVRLFSVLTTAGATVSLRGGDFPVTLFERHEATLGLHNAGVSRGRSESSPRGLTVRPSGRGRLGRRRLRNRSWRLWHRG